jgi:hypothetical protein
MKPMRQSSKAAYACVILSVAAYVVPFGIRLFVYFPRILHVPVFLPPHFFSIVFALGPLLAICAIILGHQIRKRTGNDVSASSSGVALAGIILGYIFLAYSLFALGIGLWYSHSMKDFH